MGRGTASSVPLNRCYTPRKSADLRMQCGSNEVRKSAEGRSLVVL